MGIFGDAWNAVTEFVSDPVGQTQQAVQNAGQSIQDMGDTVNRAIREYIDRNFPFLNKVGTLMNDGYTKLADFVKDVPGFFDKYFMEPVVNPVKNAISGPLNDGIANVGKAWGDLTQWSSKVAQNAQSFINKASESIAKFNPVAAISDTFSRIGKGVWGAMKAGNRIVLEQIKSAVKKGMEPYPLGMYYVKYPHSLIPIVAGVAGWAVMFKIHPVISFPKKVVKKVKGGWKHMKIEFAKIRKMLSFDGIKESFSNKLKSAWSTPDYSGIKQGFVEAK